MAHRLMKLGGRPTPAAAEQKPRPLSLCANLLGDHAIGIEDRPEMELCDRNIYAIEAIIKLAVHAIDEATESMEELTGIDRYELGTAFKVAGEGA